MFLHHTVIVPVERRSRRRRRARWCTPRRSREDVRAVYVEVDPADTAGMRARVG